MANVTPLPLESMPLSQELAGIVGIMGFTSNSLRTMARRPEILKAFSDLNVAIFSGGLLPLELKYLVGYAASAIGGCRYCQAHTSYLAHKLGVPDEKVKAVFEPGSDALNEAERAAIDLAVNASMQPGAALPEHFSAARVHYNEAEIIELLCVIGLFGFLNRWNDALATQLEAAPASFAERLLGPRGWTLAKHGGQASPDGSGEAER
jgi:alkylhydroperoxidase family enzyme